MSSVIALRRRSRISHILVLAVATSSSWSSAGHSQEQDLAKLTPEELAAKYVDDFCVWKAAEEEGELWKKLTERLEERALSREQFANGKRLDPATVEDLNALVSDNVKLFASQLATIHTTLAGEPLRGLRDDWTKVRQQRNKQDVLKAELLTSQPASMWVALVGKDVRWFWLFGFVAMGALAGVSLHYGRHEYRRALFGAKARSYGITRLLKWFLVFSAVGTVVAFFGAEHLMRFFVLKPLGVDFRSQAVMVEEGRKVAERRQAAEAQLQATLAECRGKWERWLQGENVERLREQWRQGYQMALKSRVVMNLRQKIVAELKGDASALAELDKTVKENRVAVERLERWKWAVSGGVGVAIATTTLTLAFLLLASIQRRDHIIKHTCPICLERNTLERDTEETGVGIGEAPPMVRCTHDISQNEPCPFSFPAAYQDKVKIYFPTLGVSSAGKTHWLTMVYRELNAGRYAGNVRFEKVECDGSTLFDDLVATLLQQRYVQATQTDKLPFPLIFDFEDDDTWGESNILVNVFDYSGEVAQGRHSSLRDAQRRRALKADGYLFFLDPTKDRDIQQEALTKFRRDVQQVHRRLSIRAPVALCVTKIDLLANKVPAGFLDHFFRQLNSIDPTGQEISMEVIEARSALTQKLRDILWHGWEIERLIHDLFGGRYMFFPMTPVGLDNPGAATPGAQGRMMDPFGIVEPLVWLLHMNGYPTLNKAKTKT